MKTHNINQQAESAVSNIEPDLAEGEYRVRAVLAESSRVRFTSYHFAPSSEELWTDHPSCAQASYTTGERIMVLKDSGSEIEFDDVIVKMKELGYRPATRQELVDFAHVYVSEPDKPIFALGSSMVDGWGKNFAALVGPLTICAGEPSRIGCESTLLFVSFKN